MRPRGRLTTIATGLALVAGTTAPALGSAGSGAPLRNPGFAAGLDGWTVTGDRAAATVAGAAGQEHLRHTRDRAFAVTTAQRLRGPVDGWWTVSARVRSGGGRVTASLGVTGCGAGATRTVPVTGPNSEQEGRQDAQWVRLAVPVRVRGAGCVVQVRTAGPAGAWAAVDDVEVARGRVDRVVRGVDLSGLAKNEDHGAVYADATGRRRDPVALLAASGANVGRLKVWVDPADGYNDTAHVVATARRLKAAGMRVLVDFHYSDRWADPGAQITPAAWRGYDAAQLAAAVGAHTREVLTALRRAGAPADLVQLGNEINPGLLHPLGQTWDVDPDDGVTGAQWDNVAAFLTAGAEAVAAVEPRARVLLHLTNINNGVDSLTWWFDEVTARGVPFDLIGLSYYGYWHGSLADLQAAVTTLSARYDRDVVVVETAYPWTLADHPTVRWENIIDLPDEVVPGYPATPAGQAAQFRAVQDAVVSAAGGRGLGAVYWEPAWTAVPGAGWDPEDPASGNAWENQALFDHAGRLLPGARELRP